MVLVHGEQSAGGLTRVGEWESIVCHQQGASDHQSTGARRGPRKHPEEARGDRLSQRMIFPERTGQQPGRSSPHLRTRCTGRADAQFRRAPLRPGLSPGGSRGRSLAAGQRTIMPPERGRDQSGSLGTTGGKTREPASQVWMSAVRLRTGERGRYRQNSKSDVVGRTRLADCERLLSRSFRRGTDWAIPSVAHLRRPTG